MTLDERSAVPALDRGLDILECMAGSTEALSLTELARAVGRTVSEVQRTVAQLATRAYLVRDARGAYRLSSKLFRLATAYPPFRDLVSRALAPMQEFAGATTEGVHLGVLSDDQLLLIAQVEGQGIVRLSMQLGSTQEALTTVSGRILLSGLTPAELAAFETRLGLSRIERTRLRESCAKIRGRGYEYAESGRVHGVEDVGVPVLLPGPSVIAALTTSFLPLRNAKPAPLPLISALRKAAARIASSYEPTLVSAALPERTGAKKARAHGTRAR